MFLIYTDALSSMYALMKKLSVEITEENYDTHLTADILLGYNLWMQDGGQVTPDCACVSGGKLAAFCVETEEVIYADGRKEQNHALCDWRYSQ